MSDTQEVRWTAKLPLLVIGVIAWIAGAYLLLWRRSPRMAFTGLILIMLGMGFVGYSMTIKDWCSVHSDFGGDFVDDLSACLQLKGWFEF